MDEAKAYCARCEVTDECLEYALAQDITNGVWGGMTGPERTQLRRARRRRQGRAVALDEADAPRPA